jgi:hypothetical protein
MNVYRMLMGKPVGKRPLRRYRHKWGDNIKMDLREMVGGGVEWCSRVQDRDKWRGSCEIGNEPSGFIKCWDIRE